VRDFENLYYANPNIEFLLKVVIIVWLFKPAWQNKNIRKAQDAIKKINDQTKLTQIILKAKSVQVKKDALMNLTDQELLENVFHNIKNDTNLKAEVLQKISNLALLESIIIDKDIDFRLRTAALKTHPNFDQRIVHDIVMDKSISDWDFRITAMKKLKDTTILKQIAYDVNASDRPESYVSEYIRKGAIESITNQNVLFQIVTQYAMREHPFSREMAVIAAKGIYDHKKLITIALGIPHTIDMREIEKVAISRLTDKEILTKIYNERYYKNLYPNPGEYASRRLQELRGEKKYSW